MQCFVYISSCSVWQIKRQYCWKEGLRPKSPTVCNNKEVAVAVFLVPCTSSSQELSSVSGLEGFLLRFTLGTWPTLVKCLSTCWNVCRCMPQLSHRRKQTKRSQQNRPRTQVDYVWLAFTPRLQGSYAVYMSEYLLVSNHIYAAHIWLIPNGNIDFI